MASRYLPRLLDSLATAGIPSVGAADLGPSASPRFRVDYGPAATSQHRADGAALVAAFDLSDAAQAAWETAQTRAVAKGLAVRDKAIVIWANAALNQLRTQAQQRTPAQAIAAVNAIIDAGTAD